MKARSSFASEGAGVVSAILESCRLGKKKQQGAGGVKSAPKGAGIINVIPASGRFGKKKQYGAEGHLGNVTRECSTTQNRDSSNGMKSGALPFPEQGRQAGQAVSPASPPKDSRPLSSRADGIKTSSLTSDDTDSDFCTYLKRRFSLLQNEESFSVPVADVENWLSALRTGAFRSNTALCGGKTMSPPAAAAQLYATAAAVGRTAADEQYDTTNLGVNGTIATLTLTPRTIKVISYLELIFIVSDPGAKAGTEEGMKTMLSRYIRASNLEIIIEGSLARIWGEKEEVDEASKAIEQLRRVPRGAEVATRWYWAQEKGSEDLSLLHLMRAETSGILEEAFGCRDVVRYNVNGNSYEADFTRMQQTNIQTGTARPIRRVISERQGYPWSRNPEATATSSVRLGAIAYKLVEIGGKELEMIKAAVRKTLHCPVTRVDHISNPFLWDHFVQNAKVIRNERDLFHGANSEAIPKICTIGFDRRLAGSRNGTTLGKGCYFAQDAIVAARYMDSPNRGQMIMAKVLVGRFTQGKTSMVRPPLLDDSNDHRTFDTTVDNVTRPRTFVTYMDWQAYPMYLITLG